MLPQTVFDDNGRNLHALMSQRRQLNHLLWPLEITYFDLDHVPQSIDNAQVGVSLGTLTENSNVACVQLAIPKRSCARLVVPEIAVCLIR